MPRTTREDTAPEQIMRFRRAERMMHWSIAVPFMICYTTALVLVVFYNPDPSRPYRAIFSWTHRVSGLILMSFPLLSVIDNIRDYRIHLRNMKEAWLWTFADVKWITLMGLSMISKRIKLPEEGKFNAGEKLNFMMVMTTYPIFGLTGIAIWVTSGAGLPWLIHFVIAAMVTPLMLGHIFMATINPASRKGLSGMITGFVDREWASHHYRKWFREEFDGQGRPRRTTAEREAMYAALGDEADAADYDDADHGGVGEKKGARSSSGRSKPIMAPRRKKWLERMALFFVGLLLPLLFILGGMIARSENSEEQYITKRQPMRSQRSDTGAQVPGGDLAVGARVTVAKPGDAWSMVNDARGRVGYVRTENLSAQAPLYSPKESEFPDCQLQTEAGCAAMAREHLDRCRLDCRHSDDPECADHCEERFYECQELCEAAAAKE